MTGVVGINLLWIAPGAVGGSEEYSVRTVAALARAQHDWTPVVFCRPDLAEAHPDRFEQVRLVTRPLPGRSRIARIIAENSWLPSAAKSAGVDVMHHVGGRMPARRGPYRNVLTIHDLQPIEVSANFSAIKAAYLRRAIPRSVQRADAVVGVSEHVADQLRERFGRADAAAVPSPFEPIELSPAHHLPDEVAAAGGAPFVLYPAVTHPHKNHRTLLEAIRLLSDRGVKVMLVSTGGEGDAERGFHDAVDELDLGDRVVRLGRVERPILDALLQKTAILAFPSTYEGFGIPLLEAMAANCPIVASDASAVPEVVGDAALLVPPHDPQAWADAITSIIDRDVDPEAMVRRGQSQVRRYTRARSAEALVAAYDRAMSRTST